MKSKLTKSEKEILESFERGEWKPVQNREKEFKKHRMYAESTVKKGQTKLFPFQTI